MKGWIFSLKVWGLQYCNIPTCISVSPTVDCLIFWPNPGSSVRSGSGLSKKPGFWILTQRILIQNPVQHNKKMDSLFSNFKTNKKKQEKEKEVSLKLKKMYRIPVINNCIGTSIGV